MDTEGYAVSRFDGAVLLLPYKMRERVRGMDRRRRAVAEEIRLRSGRPPGALMPEGELSFGGDPVTRRDLEFVLELATDASQHHVKDKLRMGFVTARGGYRIGICGPVNVLDGRAAGFAAISSLNIRISREVKGAASELMRRAELAGPFPPTVIISPPGLGKTTLLRDMVRILSDGAEGRRPSRVAVCDERSEIAAFYDGTAGFDVGSHTDVLDACPKAEGITMLLRAMNPQIIAIDEITCAADASAVVTASHCGVSILATAHALDTEDFASRPVYAELLRAGVFRYAVTIGLSGGRRRYELVRL